MHSYALTVCDCSILCHLSLHSLVLFIEMILKIYTNLAKSFPDTLTNLLATFWAIILITPPWPWQAGLVLVLGVPGTCAPPDLLLSGQVRVWKHRLRGAKGGTLGCLVYYSWVAPVEWAVIQHPNPRCGSICAPFNALTAGHWSIARYPGAE